MVDDKNLNGENKTSENNAIYSNKLNSDILDEHQNISKIFWLVSISLIVFLFIIAGGFFYFSFIKDTNDKTSSNNATSTQVEIIDFTLTGGSDTPATKARKNTSLKVENSWLLQNFLISNSLSTDGSCQKVEVCGNSSDPDSDGLTNLQEYNFGTDPNNSDTDGDGLSDGNELFIYYSDPLLTDSDQDGEKDGAEVIKCYNPIKKAVKYSDSELLKLSSNVGLYPLKEPTISTLKQAKAISEDLEKNGYILQSCKISTETTPSTKIE